MADEPKNPTTFTITIPKVGVGLQGLTFSLLVWLGGQASTFVDQLIESMEGLTVRVERLESAMANVGVDPHARERTVALEAEVKALEKVNADQDKRIQTLEECLKKGRRRCP